MLRSSSCGRALFLATLASDRRHVFAILTHHHAPFSSRFAGLFGGEFMGGSFRVGGLAALARDVALFVRIHRRESAPARIVHGLFLSVVGPKYDTFSHSDCIKTTLRPSRALQKG